MLGVMLDCSRNAVMTVNAVKHYVDYLAKMGYDTLMLYTEDTYEVDNEPYFGYMRGRFTKDELKEIDKYCLSVGIELIPCIQTLAHLNGIFQISDKYSDIRDCDDILLIGEERTYELIENIFCSLAECFTSRNVHIGMDEAGKVGLGKYLNKNGYTDRFDLINSHLKKVVSIAEKYGFSSMIWSDMFCRLATGSNDYFKTGNASGIKEKANLPESVKLVYWDYYNTDYNHYTKMLTTNKAFERPVVFAGGAWTWKGFMPSNGFSIKTTEVAFSACRDQGVNDVFLTVWGDDGAECSRYSVLPSLLFSAEVYRGNTDMENIKQKFFELTDTAWDDVMLLDMLDLESGEHEYNSSKYLLFNDPFMGLKDYRIDGSEGKYYADLSKKLKNVRAGADFKPIFKEAADLCEALSLKAELGTVTRSVYMLGDKQRLKELAQNDYPQVKAAIEKFYNSFKARWTAENKPFGFDVQDIRFGGMVWRLKQCAQRLLDYADGKIQEIPELAEEILPDTNYKKWADTITPNVITHIYFA